MSRVTTNGSLPSRLPLKGWDWLGHYGLPIYFSGIAGVLIYCMLFVTPAQQAEPTESDGWGGGLIEMAAVLFAIALMVLRRQRRVLGLQHRRTPRKAAENFTILLNLARDEGWRIGAVLEDRYLRFHVPARWYDFCWGEMVSVFLDGNALAFNSICDPTKTHPSVVSWGRNAANIEKVKQALQVD